MNKPRDVPENVIDAVQQSDPFAAIRECENNVLKDPSKKNKAEYASHIKELANALTRFSQSRIAEFDDLIEPKKGKELIPELGEVSNQIQNYITSDIMK